MNCHRLLVDDELSYEYMLNARRGKTKTMIRFLLFEQINNDLLYFYAVASSFLRGKKSLDLLVFVLLTFTPNPVLDVLIGPWSTDVRGAQRTRTWRM